MMKSVATVNTINAGAPHFRTEARKYRNANYTLEKVINEAVDNIIKKATEIHLTTEVDSDGRLQELKISDNYVHGFQGINLEGVANPFNMGHIRTGHDADDETSEFGVGLKAGALSAANVLSVVTSLGNRALYQVVCDFLKMEQEEDVMASYNPKLKEITEEDYKQSHPFATGSSIILSKIRGAICEQTTQQELTDRIKKNISETYSRFLTANMRIFVNKEEVSKEIDFFTDVKCVQFTVNKKLFVLEKGGDKLYLINKIIENSVWQILVKMNKEKNAEAPPSWVWKWESLKQNGLDFIKEKQKEGYKCVYHNGSVVSDGSCMSIDTIFTFYSDLFHTKDPKLEPEKPFDHVLIYKDNRKYGKKSLSKQILDGNNTYTLHRIDFNSKQIGKELGITFNKDITMELKNDLTTAVKAAIDDSRLEFNSNVSTGKNEKLCEKAIKRQIINFDTCNIDKLSTYHRDLRRKNEEAEQKKEEARKKREADELKKAMEADILRKKREVEEAEAKRVELLRLEAEKLRLEKHKKETPEEKVKRLAEEKRLDEAEKVKREAEQKRIAELEQEAKRIAELEAEKEREAKRIAHEKAEKEREAKRIAELEAEKEREAKRIALLKSQQEDSRRLLREASQFIMDKIASDELISLEDSDVILKKVKELLKI